MNELDLFAAAIAIADPAERASLLDRECAGNGELRARIERLLAAHDRASSFLERPAAAVPDATSALGGEDRPVRHDDEVPLGFLEPSTKPDSLGRLGHYEVLEVLGRGGFGIVLKAFDDSLHRVVAVKVLSPVMAATSPARKRFLREARASAPIRHENVVQVYAIEETPLPYIVMEFVPGHTLQTFLDGTGPLEVPDVVRIGIQIARGLAAAHELGLIHRDIKPANILLEGGIDRRVKITDFGLARAADDASITASGVVAGTPLYMAPEQARGEHLDHRADLFSLGSVLYTMCSGHPPFRANSTLAVLKRVCDETPRPIPEIIPEVPHWLCDIISKLHAKNPDKRFQSAREVADLLAKYAVEPPLGEAKAERKLVAVSRPSRSNFAIAMRVLFAAVGVLFLMAVAVIAVYFASQGKKPADPVRAEPPSGDQLPTGNRLPTTYKNTLGMEFALVPKGKAWLGGSKGKFGDQKTEFTEDLYLGVNEVTQKEWTQVMGDNPSSFSRSGIEKGKVQEIPLADLEQFPVDNVTWDDCQAFLKKLNEQAADTGWTYRLPTQAEWEYACRGGPMKDESVSAFDFYVDGPRNELTADMANYGTGADNPPTAWLGRTTRTRSFPPNPLGLYDMHGNVWEWCDDCLPDVDGVPHRVFRGGAFNRGANICTATSSVKQAASKGSYAGNGLRVARVRVGSPAPGLTPVAPITAAQRKALEWVLSVGGTVYLKSGWKFLPLHQGDRLPDGPFTTRGIYLRGIDASKQVDDNSIENLKALPHFDLLALAGPRVSDVGLAKLASYPWFANLEHLALDDAPLSDAGMTHLKNCKRLNWLTLNNGPVTSKGLAALRGLPLSTLGLQGCRQVEDDAADILADVPTLTSINLSGTGFTPEGIVKLGRLPALMDLYVSGEAVTDDLVAVVKLKGLTGLRVDSPSVTDAGLARLTSLPALQDLVFTESKAVTDAAIEHIAKCKNLRTFNVKRCGITEAGVKKLVASRPDLRIWWDGGIIEPKATQSDVPAGDWVQLFNGKDLTGWSNAKDATGNWKVVDGAITCSGTNDNLYTKRDDFGDFHLRAEVKCNKPANGGIYFRTRKPLADGGDYEAQIAIDFKHGMGQMTGSLWRLVVVKETPVAPDTWFTYEIIAQGNRIRLLVNGKETADYTENRAGRRTKGHIALQHHHVGSEVHFRKIEVREWVGGVIQPKVVADPDRRAAEWVLSVGGSVKINVAGREQHIQDAGELPPGTFQLTVVILNKDDGLVEDVGLAHFQDCKNLTSVNVMSRRVTDAGLAHFKNSKDLSHLWLIKTGVTDAGLAHFKDHKKLTDIHLGQTAVTDAGLANFKDHKAITDIHLNHTSVTDAGLAYFKDHPLRVLDLWGAKVTDAVLANLNDRRTLGILNLGETQISDASLALLKDCKNLTNLDLRKTQITDAGLDHLKNCQNLTNIGLNDTRVGDAGLAHLKDCKKLRTVWLQGTPVTDAGLGTLKGFPELNHVWLNKTAVTAAGVAGLQKALPQCKIEWDGGAIEPK